MSVLNENTIIGASGAGGDYEIEQSLRFDEGRETRLTRTPTSNGNAKTWTWSAWVKRSELSNSAQSTLFAAGVYNGSSTHLHFASDNTLHFYQYDSSYIFREESTQVFRDASAWYHIVAVVDTTNGTAADRIKLYVNGVQITSFANVLNPNQNQNTFMNLTANKNYIGDFDRSGDGDEFGGYLGEINFIDGQALTPDSFGETGKYGEWKPIEYAGTYGTNGFYLPFEQDYSVEGFSTVVWENDLPKYVGGVGFQSDLLWAKSRLNVQNHVITDAVTGFNGYGSTSRTNAFYSNLTSIAPTADGFTSNTDFFTNGQTYVAWNWDMGSATASNTDGTITTSVRANTTYGQSIVSWTGNATNNTKLGHGLDSTPEIVIVKSRTTAAPWKVGGSVIQAVYGDGSNNSAFLSLNTTAAADQETTGFQGNTATTIGVGANSDTNSNGATYIAYAFHSVTGYSKFSSYSGNGSTTGPTVALGFSPAFLMVKCSSSTEPWTIVDSTRNPTNPRRSTLVANSSAAKADMSAGTGIDFTSTGFQVKTNIGNYNASGQTYIYMAFADTREYAYWLDQSGNNNDWESEGGLTESDVMVDSPTNNFATLNPLDMNIDSYAITVSEGNLQAAGPSEGRSLRGTMGMPSGKWYWEVCTTVSGVYNVAGIAKNSSPLNAVLGNDANSYTMFSQSGAKFNNGSTSSYGSAWNAAGNICGIAFDADNGTLVFYVNNSSQGTAFTGLTSGDFLPALAVRTGKAVVNFGSDSSFAGNKTPQGKQDSNDIGDFYYAPPTGFLALCTANLPEVDVIPTDNFNTVIYSGTGADNRVLSGVGFTPDLGIFKRRNGTGPSQFFDTLRGATKQLRSDTTSAESTQGNKQKTFTSDGYTLGTDAQINGSGGTYVAWNWKAGGSASSNSNGSITSQVSANVDAGFSIVSYTALDSDETVGHGLSQKPELVLVKRRNSTGNWVSHWTNLTTTNKQLYLNLTNALDSNNINSVGASTFRVNGWADVATANGTYISYCFHSVDGYSKVGSYVGNGNVDGPMVNLGFKPKFMIVKRATEVGVWFMFDTERSPHNVMNTKLNANSSDAEDSDTSWNIDFLSNGFKLRGNHVYINSQNNSHIFIAFAENPFKHSNAR